MQTTNPESWQLPSHAESHRSRKLGTVTSSKCIKNKRRREIFVLGKTPGDPEVSEVCAWMFPTTLSLSRSSGHILAVFRKQEKPVLSFGRQEEAP